MTRNCAVEGPEGTSFSTYTPQNAYQYPGPGSILLPGYPANGVGLYQAPTPSEMAFRGLSAPSSMYIDSVGIRWDGYVRTSASPNPWGGDGGWHFVQKAQGNRYRVNSGVRQSMAENGLDLLDTRYPYEPGPFDPEIDSPGTYPADGSTGTAADGPNTGSFLATMTEVEINEHFGTWMMYRPPGDGSVFVPLKKIKWSWYGKAQKTGGTWNMVLPSDSGWQFDGDYPLFPLWTGRSGPLLDTWNP